MIIPFKADEKEAFSIKNTFKDLKILIVDDDTDDLLIIEDLLGEGLNESTRLDFAKSFTEALVKLQSRNYDLCLFDYRLGKDNGVELLRACRSEGILTPIIFLTGQTDDLVAVEMMKAGAADYISKLFLNSSDLCTAIYNSLKKQKHFDRILNIVEESKEG